MVESNFSPAEPTDHPNPVDVDKVVCERLRARRLIMGISQAELGSLTCLSPQQIHKYESGASRMTAGRLVQFASVLRVPLAYFYDGVETEQRTPQRIINLLADPGTIELLQNYWKISKPLRLATLAYMRAITAETVGVHGADLQAPSAQQASTEQDFDASSNAS